MAKLLGAGRVVAAGRNPERLEALRELGADATIRLDAPHEELQEAFVREAGERGFQVVIDYVWGAPTEAFLQAITKREFSRIGSEIRLVQVGESAAPTIRLPAAALRSTALTIQGTAGIPPMDILQKAFQQVMGYAANKELGMEIEKVPLSDVEKKWNHSEPGRRMVMLP
jgi:NADPH:quinone reductase-like Zn-dependent oxidoreductase